MSIPKGESSIFVLSKEGTGRQSPQTPSPAACITSDNSPGKPRRNEALSTNVNRNHSARGECKGKGGISSQSCKGTLAPHAGGLQSRAGGLHRARSTGQSEFPAPAFILSTRLQKQPTHKDPLLNKDTGQLDKLLLLWLTWLRASQSWQPNPPRSRSLVHLAALELESRKHS